MEDQKIIDLYTNREERAIHETDKNTEDYVQAFPWES